MFGMLGGLGLGSKIAIGMGVLLLATMAASGFYFKYSQDKMAEMNQEIAVEKAARASAEANLDAMRQDFRTQQKELGRLADEMQKNREESANLRDTFAEHDLNDLAAKKPGLVEGVVNRGTARVLKRLEDITDPRSYDDVDQFVVPEEDEEQD
jgi:hypothetical protein